jgi:membrane protease YdiL (CAAX protease family)
VSGRWIGLTLVTMAGGYVTLRLTSWDVAVALVFTVALTLLGLRSGLTWDDLGLGAGTRLRGARWALGSVVVVAAGYVLVALTPAATALEDARYDRSWTSTLVTAFVVVPLGTVLWEEMAFRGVLWGQLHARWSAQGATLTSSLLFGLWHALPALRFAEANQAVGQVGAATGTDSGWVATGVTVAATVVVTFLAGLVLCELRRRSGSLLAPIGLHWATNGLGVLAVAWVS